MTREEFVSNAVAWHGSAVGWQSALAKALDINPKTVQRAAKDGPSDKLASLLMGLFGDSAPARVPAEWICGDGSDGCEYLVHTHHPRFHCLVLTEDEYDRLPRQGDGDYFTGEAWLTAFQWIDRRPENLAQWMERASDALAEFS